MTTLDLNLLHIVVVLHQERSVSRAAERLEMSQPALSGALARLRASLADPLFVRSGGCMQPTERTLSLLKPIQHLLAVVRDDILVSTAFAPQALASAIVIALSDVGEVVFLPRLLKAIRSQAPQATLRSVDLPHAELPEALEAGRVDLAIGYFPDLRRANVFQQRLLSHHFICLLRAGHPLAARPRLTLEQFVQLEHAVVRAPGRSQEILEQYLKDACIQRKVALVTPHFLSIPSIVARSDLVVTVPHAMGIAFGRPEYGLKAVQPPFPSPRIALRQHWHRRFNAAPRSVWLRQLVSQLFTDERDEWKQQAA